MEALALGVLKTTQGLSVDSTVRAPLARLVRFQGLWQGLLFPRLRAKAFPWAKGSSSRRGKGPQCCLFSPLSSITTARPASCRCLPGSPATTELQLVVGGTKNLV